jgi:hypothetical protein
MAWENDTALVPVPSPVPPLAGARVPNASLQVPGFAVLYRNQPVAVAPLGLAEPFKVAELEVTTVAASGGDHRRCGDAT